MALQPLSSPGPTKFVSTMKPQREATCSLFTAQYNPNNPVPSHFTQVVWKATTEVGCAVQSCSGIFAASFGVCFCIYDQQSVFDLRVPIQARQILCLRVLCPRERHWRVCVSFFINRKQTLMDLIYYIQSKCPGLNS